MAYINAFVTHFRAVQDWGLRNQASMQLELTSFELEVKCRGRYFTFLPQFFQRVDGHFANTEKLTPDTGGFAGWLPYRPLSYELSKDKLQFKSFMASAGFRTPRQWDLEGASAPERDYLLKRSTGSYGGELSGPFRAGSPPDSQRQPEGPAGTVFAEEYVEGSALKVWCWGQRPVFAHDHQPKRLMGDGTHTVRHLLDQELAKVGESFGTYGERRVLDDCLSFQGLSLDDVPAEGTAPFFDYRYGRDTRGRSSLRSDDDWPGLPKSVQDEVARAARAIAEALRGLLPAPVLYSVDGVIDSKGDVFWLEINSNPTMPPEGYAAMFSDLFAG